MKIADHVTLYPRYFPTNPSSKLLIYTWNDVELLKLNQAELLKVLGMLLESVSAEAQTSQRLRSSRQTEQIWAGTQIPNRCNGIGTLRANMLHTL